MRMELPHRPKEIGVSFRYRLDRISSGFSVIFLFLYRVGKLPVAFLLHAEIKRFLASSGRRDQGLQARDLVSSASHHYF